MEIKLIKEVFPVVGSPYFFQGIFQFLNLDAQVYSAEDLATDYFLGNSGCKICSPLMLNLLGGSIIVDSTISGHIYTLLRNRFGEKWRRLYATTTADYNPIHNYDMSEQEHRELTGDKNDTNTRNLTDTTNHGMTNTSDDYIYGFNSTDEQPSNKYTSADGGTTVVLNTGTNTNDIANHEIEDITRTRAGNIGVTTTQQMLSQERELWNWNFINQMFKDIDSVLTLRIYDSCRV